MFVTHARVSTLLVVFACSAVGCTANVAFDSIEAGAATTHGLVLIEQSSDHQAVSTSISAKFYLLQSRSDVSIANRIIGIDQQIPPIGSCSSVISNNANITTRGGTIALIDVGDVSVSQGGRHISLGMRAFPDVGDIVSGVFYSKEDVAFENTNPSIITGTGSLATDPFEVRVSTPSPMTDIYINNEPLSDSNAVIASENTTIGWSTDPQNHSIVYIDIIHSSSTLTRCAFSDSGYAVVPSHIFSRLHATSSSIPIRLHRWTETSFTTDDIDVGHVIFDSSVFGIVKVNRESF